MLKVVKIILGVIPYIIKIIVQLLKNKRMEKQKEKLSQLEKSLKSLDFSTMTTNEQTSIGRSFWNLFKVTLKVEFAGVTIIDIKIPAE